MKGRVETMEDQAARSQQLELLVRNLEQEVKLIRGTLEAQSAALNRVETALRPGTRANLGTRWARTLSRKWIKGYAHAYRLLARAILCADLDQLFDRQYYISLHPDLAGSGIDPIFHYLTAKSRISPHGLFDADYYLARYPDVARANVDPLIHFLRAGWREGRNPHILFNTSFYLEQAPALRAGKINPVSHYLHVGWRNGLLPHPLFDPAYYLANYPDVAATGNDPLSHYISFGAREGRQPHPWFDSGFYRASCPDVVAAGVDPLQHYVNHGSVEGRDPHPHFETSFYSEEYGDRLDGTSPLEHYVRFGAAQGLRITRTDCVERFLPVVPYSPPEPRRHPVDIVIPIYRGLSETKACIESVLAARNFETFEVIAIDDCSPEPALSAWLREASANRGFTLIRNETNCGFVATVNRGMAIHPDRDVVLLNSDTTVANDWLDRLVRCAYSRDRVGTVTPFSNNATICSYPRFCEDNPPPKGVCAEDLDRLTAVVNQGRAVEIPTAVGFCMYIRRQCLAEIGLFDAEVFKRGYGEENDFSRKAAGRGWLNVLAADVFVYHAGSVSFGGGAGLLQERAARALVNLHPDYNIQVARHVSKDPANPYRFALTAARYRDSGKPTVLLVSHDLGGGVAQHMRDLVTSVADGINWLELRPAGEGFVTMVSADPADGISLRLNYSRQYDVLVSLLRSCNVKRVHVHHLLRHGLDVERLSHDLRATIAFTAHDYFSICPRIYMADPAGRYCSEPDEAGCNRCIRKTLPHVGLDIASWRAKYSWLVKTADLAIAPSIDVANRLGRYFPASRILAASHPEQPRPDELPDVQPSRIEPPDGVLRVAVLGVMSYHKGLLKLQECSRMVLERKLPIEFVLIGFSEPGIRQEGPFSFPETGRYRPEDLPAILAEVSPGVVWFPGQIPETFGYTLTACLREGLPVAVPSVGALPERLSGRSWSWVYEWDSGVDALVAMFERIRNAMIWGIAPSPVTSRPQADPDFYPKRYLDLGVAAMPAPNSILTTAEPGTLSVTALLSSDANGQIQSCGYIRGFLPLTHRGLGDAIRLNVASPVGALNIGADALLVQRASVPSLKVAEELVRYCEDRGVRLIYETDDDLFHVQTTQSENEFYAARVPAAELILRSAATVVVSTPTLRDRVAPLNPDVHVLPNALDERLWFPAGCAQPKRPSSSGPLRILYMGTMTHSKDLALLEDPMRRLREEFGSRVELEILGITPDQRPADWFNVAAMPEKCAASYPMFVEWIREQNRWTFGVAPLVDNEFNRCKSFIKYLDYGALGMPGIFSAIGVYEGVVRHRETGFLVSDPAQWYDAISLLLTDRKLVEEMGEAAYNDVRANHTLEATAESRRNFWIGIASKN